MFDVNLIAGINLNVQKIMDDVAHKKTNLDRDHANDAYTLIKYHVLDWQGDAALARNAENVLQEVATGAKNLDRAHAKDVAAAMQAGSLSIVAG